MGRKSRLRQAKKEENQWSRVDLPSPPQFNGTNFAMWTNRMRVYLRYVDTHVELNDEAKDALALHLIQLAVDDRLMQMIAAAKTSKEAWRILEEEFSERGSNMCKQPTASQPVEVVAVENLAIEAEDSQAVSESHGVEPLVDEYEDGAAIAAADTPSIEAFECSYETVKESVSQAEPAEFENSEPHCAEPQVDEDNKDDVEEEAAIAAAENGELATQAVAEQPVEAECEEENELMKSMPMRAEIYTNRLDVCACAGAYRNQPAIEQNVNENDDEIIQEFLKNVDNVMSFFEAENGKEGSSGADKYNEDHEDLKFIEEWLAKPKHDENCTFIAEFDKTFPVCIEIADMTVQDECKDFITDFDADLKLIEEWLEKPNYVELNCTDLVAVRRLAVGSIEVANMNEKGDSHEAAKDEVHAEDKATNEPEVCAVEEGKTNLAAGLHVRSASPRSCGGRKSNYNEEIHTPASLSSGPRLGSRRTTVVDYSSVHDDDSLYSNAVPNYMTATESARGINSMDENRSNFLQVAAEVGDDKHMRKKHKKERSYEEMRCDIIEDQNNTKTIEIGNIHAEDNGTLQSKEHKSKKKIKDKKAKSWKVHKESEEFLESGHMTERCPAREHDQVQALIPELENASAASQVEKGSPSRSARRKKAKRRWLREQKDKNQEKNSTLDSQIFSKCKKLQKSNQSDDAEAEEESLPVIVRPGHIRFEPINNEQESRGIQDSTPALHWNGITNKRQGQNWGKERNYLHKVEGSACPQEKEIFPSHSGEERSFIQCPLEFDKLPSMSGVPQEGDIIAYRLVELSTSWCPELSSFRVGTVAWYDCQTTKIRLAPVSEYPFEFLNSLGEEEDANQTGISPYNDDGSLDIDFASLVDVRWVHQHKPTSEPIHIEGENKISSTDTGTRVPVAEEPGRIETHANGQRNLKSSADKNTDFPDIEKLATETHANAEINSKSDITNFPVHTEGNGEIVSIWQEINQVFSAKKAELALKNDQSKVEDFEDEIEVDIESFDTETLWELDRFVNNCKKKVRMKKKVKKNAEFKVWSKRKKKKPLHQHAADKNEPATESRSPLEILDTRAQIFVRSNSYEALFRWDKAAQQPNSGRCRKSRPGVPHNRRGKVAQMTE